MEPTDRLESALTRLDDLIGLDGVKQQVNGLISTAIINQEREQSGKKVPTRTNHLIFSGNPGTGKTTVARTIKDLYYSLGLIKKDTYVEAKKSDLVGDYQGETPNKARKYLEKHAGGVIFIDEAYNLVQGRSDDYGKQALAEILTFADDHRNDTAIIMAGYPKDIQQLLAHNPGLSRRFPKNITFEDYSRPELGQIVASALKQNENKMTPKARKAMTAAVDALYTGGSTGNAGDIRNMLESIHEAQDERLVNTPGRKESDLMVITDADVAIGAARHRASKVANEGPALVPTGRRKAT